MNVILILGTQRINASVGHWEVKNAECPSTSAFSPQHKSHSKSWAISECEVYRPINHINTPLSLVIDSQMY